MTTLKFLPQSNTSTLEEAIRTIYSPNIEMAINVLEAEEVTFTLVSNKKHKEKNKVSFLPSISSSNSRSKTLLILWALSLPKARTTYLVSKPVIICPGLAMISSPAMITSKTIKL